MNIGIDARVLYRVRTGIGVSLENLLYKLQKIDNKNSYFLFSNRDFEFNIEKSTWRKIIHRGFFCRIGTLWLQLSVPFLIKKFGIDVFWGHEHVIPIPGRCRKIVTIHDLAYIYYPESMLLTNYFINRFFIPMSIRESYKIITVSHATESTIVDNFKKIKRDKIHVIHNGPSFNMHNVSSDESLLREYSIESPYILTVSSIEPRKNIVTLLTAYKMMGRDDVKLVIAGGFGWKKKGFLKFLSKNRDIEKNLVLLSHFKPEKLYSLYKNAMLFVFPSLFEGFGIPVLEAMSAGTPVISSNASSLPEVGGAAVVYFNPKNPEELAKKMGELIDNPLLREKYSRFGKERSKEFSWEKSAEKLLQVLTT